MTALDIFTQQLDSLRIQNLHGVDVWSARDLMSFAGYTEWRKFNDAINRAMSSIDSADMQASDHIVPAAKLVQIGSGASRQIEDVQLTRYGCYILFQNGDPRKPEIARAQQYFAIKTRESELAQPELPTDFLSALKALVASTESNMALEAKVADDAPKVAYVDEFLDSEDVVLFRVAASEIGIGETAMRNRLIDAGWIYKQRIGWRFSKSQNKQVEEIEYRASSAHGSKFRLMPQHNAPRHHNGQVKQTLYVRSDALPAISRRVLTELVAVNP